MAYYGNAPADVALVVGQDVITTTEIQDSTIATADIANDAITALKIDDDGTGFQMGSLGLGTAVSGSEKLTVGGTASFSGDITGTLATSAQTNITSVGTLSSLTVSGVASLGNNSKVTSSSADTTFKIETTSGTTIFPVLDFVSSHSSVGAKIRQDGSDVITIDNDQDVTFSDDVTISGNTFMNGSYLGINNVGYIRSASNELRLQTGTGGLNVMNNAYNTSLFSITNAGTATFVGQVEVDGSYLQIDNGGVRTDRHGNPPYILMEYDGSSVAQLRGTSGGGLNITDCGAGTTWQSFDSSGNATFEKNIITKSESNHTFTSSGTDNVAIKRQV